MAYTLLGQNFTPPDVEPKVNGKAKYAEDYRVEGMVFCRLLLSPVPHGRVTNIDASEALAMEGVVGAAASALVCAISDALGGHYFARTPIVADMIVNAAAGREQSHRPLQVSTA